MVREAVGHALEAVAPVTNNSTNGAADLPQGWCVVSLGQLFTSIPKRQRQVRVLDDGRYRLLTVRLYAKGVVLRSEAHGAAIGTKNLFKAKAGDFVFSKIDARNGAWGFVPAELDGALVSGDFPLLQLNCAIADQEFIELMMMVASSSVLMSRR